MLVASKRVSTDTTDATALSSKLNLLDASNTPLELIQEITGWISITKDLLAYLSTTRAHDKTRAPLCVLIRVAKTSWDLHMQARSMALMIEDRLSVSVKSIGRLCQPDLTVVVRNNDLFVLHHALYELADIDKTFCRSIKLTPLMIVAEKGHEQCVLALIEAKANIEATHMYGWTALFMACLNGHEQCARALIEAGAEVDKGNANGRTSLMTASMNGHESCIRVLLDNGAGVNKAESNGFTSLMNACQNGHEQCAQALIKAKADLEKQTAKGSTALILAARNGHEMCAQALIEAGADIEKPDNNG